MLNLCFLVLQAGSKISQYEEELRRFQEEKSQYLDEVSIRISLFLYLDLALLTEFVCTCMLLHLTLYINHFHAVLNVFI